MANQKRKSAPEAGVSGVQIDADANDRIQRWCDQHESIKRGVLSRIVRWWTLRDELFQMATLKSEEGGEYDHGGRFADLMASAMRETADTIGSHDVARIELPHDVADSLSEGARRYGFSVPDYLRGLLAIPGAGAPASQAGAKRRPRGEIILPDPPAARPETRDAKTAGRHG